MNQKLALSIQRALIGEVPSTLRFLYAKIYDNTLHFHVVFTDDATDEHLECASVALTEVIADCDASIQLDEIIERNNDIPWRQGTGKDLYFLRHGELSDT
jgi:hypothetical protein